MMNKKGKSKKIKITSALGKEESGKKDEETPKVNNIKTKMANERYNSNYEDNVCISEDNTSKKKKKNIERIDTTVPTKKTKSDCDSVQSSLPGENIKISINKEEYSVNDEQEKVIKSDKYQKNSLKYLNSEESQIKEEDIDEYCEDLDEESNSQYEDWIKLIEAKLHSKKAK